MGGSGGSALRGDNQWMTPTVPNGGRHVPPELVVSKGMTEDGQKRTVGLESQSKYWATPTSSENSNRTTKIAPTHGNGHGLVLAGQAASWATTRANDAEKRGNVAAREFPELVSQAQALPTPRSTDGTKGGPNQAGSKGDLMLPSAAAQWPTPNAHVIEHKSKPPIVDGTRKPSDPQISTADFAVHVFKQWPTPAARDAKGANSEEHCMVTGGGAQAHGSVEQLRRPLFAPGPSDPAWAGIIAAHPELAPALEPDFRGVVDGMAFAMDESRAQRLKCVGNGVVALCAATAFVVLARRAGFNRRK